MFFERITLSQKTKVISRTAFDMWDLFSNLGGVLGYMTFIGAALCAPFAEISYQFNAIHKMVDAELVKPTFIEKVRLLTRVCGNRA